jgi:hypothetical protein
MKMKLKQVIDHYGGELQTAAALERSLSCIAKWRKLPTLPTHAQWEIQGRTEGVLKADKPKKAKS